VLVAAELLVNGESAGVRVARPFKFELTDLLRKGANMIEVRVANTIAPHYTTIPSTHLGPTESGLMGPVRILTQLEGTAWIAWARGELARLENILDKSTPALEAAQKNWESRALWHNVDDATSKRGVLEADVNITELTGVRLEIPPDTLKSSRGTPLLTGISGTITPLDETPVAGRTVRIAIPDRAEHLALAEVQVFSDGKNVALDGTARQSATSAGGVAGRAIDGNTNGQYFQDESVSHTPNHMAPWWELDLGKDRPVERIVIWNRTDGSLEERLRGFEVTIRDAAGDVVFQRRYEDPPNPDMTIHLCGPRRLVFTEAAATSAATGCPAEHVLDDDPRTGWAPRTEAEPPHAVCLALDPRDIGGAATAKARLRLRLDIEQGGAPTPLQLAVTASPVPLTDVPADIAAIVQKPDAGRSAEERETLAAFYRGVAPELVSIRQRLRSLKCFIEAI